MINFHTLHVKVNEKYSFVGIQKLHNQAVFFLPKGFIINSFATYDSKRDLFFLFYRVLSKFKNICYQKNYQKTDIHIRTQDRDGVIRSSASTQSIRLPDTTENEEIILYSKLDFIDSILSVYDEPKILSLAYRLGRSEKTNYSKLHLYLHRAVYLDNGAVHIDNMASPRLEVHFESTDIIAMYCYILIEVKQQLNEEVSSELAVIAEKFQHKYIGAEYSLFNEEYSSQVVDILKDTLQLIDRNTPLKDADFWYFYDAIELFLHGELSKVNDGEIWGINNFHQVWESMCLTYIAKTVPPEYILYLDTRLISHDIVSLVNSKPKVVDLTNTFIMNGTQVFPDAVILDNGFNYFPQDERNIYTLGIYKSYNGTNWNDYCYETRFHYRLIGDDEYNIHCDLKIAYEGQITYNHTFNELINFYRFYGSRKSSLAIDSQLPKKFYSFWDIDTKGYTSMHLMYQLNHVFYVALASSIFTREEFTDFLFNKLDIKITNDNVFNTSLFRYYTEKDDKRYIIIKQFENFVKSVCSFKIIDVKYFNTDYIFDNSNRNKLKERSVRKQFVYEHLLSKHVSKNDKYKELEIQSDFWLPSWRDDSQLLENSQEYLNGYINLKMINFAAIVGNYLS
jgi:hypothetical protein